MPPDLASRIAEHLALVSLAMAIGLILAIPLGVLAARRPVLARLEALEQLLKKGKGKSKRQE